MPTFFNRNDEQAYIIFGNNLVALLTIKLRLFDVDGEWLYSESNANGSIATMVFRFTGTEAMQAMAYISRNIPITRQEGNKMFISADFIRKEPKIF